MIQSVNKYHIYEIFSSDGNFYYTIPKYQREYTWSYREWESLYDDISENNDEYFIGSIICIPLGDAINPYLEVIDGQQRLTTVSLFLTAIYTRLKESGVRSRTTSSMPRKQPPEIQASVTTPSVTSISARR